MTNHKSLDDLFTEEEQRMATGYLAERHTEALQLNALPDAQRRARFAAEDDARAARAKAMWAQWDAEEDEDGLEREHDEDEEE